MWALIWAFLGGWRSTFVAAGAVSVAMSLAAAYDRAFDDPAVAARARHDYVLRSELDAERAKAAKADGLRQAAEHALYAYTRRAADEMAADDLYTERLEQRIADNEKLLAARGRACLLDDADIDFVRNSDRAKAEGRR